MALIKCKECGKEVSSDAAACPNCGAKPKKTSKAKEIIIGLIALGVISAWLSSGSKSTTPAAPAAQATESKAPTKEIVQVSAADLFKAYESNEVATDEKVKGRIVEISGRIQAIDKDFMDNVVINLATPNEFMPARLTMLDSEKATAASLKKGGKTTIRCDKMSRIVGSPAGSDCTFFEQKK